MYSVVIVTFSKRFEDWFKPLLVDLGNPQVQYPHERFYLDNKHKL